MPLADESLIRDPILGGATRNFPRLRGLCKVTAGQLISVLLAHCLTAYQGSMVVFHTCNLLLRCLPCSWVGTAKHLGKEPRITLLRIRGSSFKLLS